jgi:hypothetical protein
MVPRDGWRDKRAGLPPCGLELPQHDPSRCGLTAGVHLASPYKRGVSLYYEKIIEPAQLSLSISSGFLVTLLDPAPLPLSRYAPAHYGEGSIAC